MAEVRECFGRRAHDFALKLYNRYLLESQNKYGKSAINASSSSGEFLLGANKHGGPCGAETAAAKVTFGVSQCGYTRVKTPPDPLWENGHIVYDAHYRGINSKNQVQIIDRNQNQSFAKFWRTFSSCPSPGPGLFVFTRAYSGNGDRSEPLYRTKTGYYEILEVSPTATQAQIKTAYYKQSFIYHPDRNSGSDTAADRFTQISEAYTVLGNKALRRKYDRGLLTQSDLTATVRPSAKDTAGGSGKQQTGGRRSVVGVDNRGGIFDFDKFYKAHYSHQLEREREIRLHREELQKKKRRILDDQKLEQVMGTVVWILLFLAAGIVSLNK